MKPLSKASVFAISLVVSSSVFAQSTKDKIPQELLDLDRKRCETDCIPGFGEETCKPLCECTVVEFQKRLNFDKYLELSAQLTRNEISPENRLLLDVIAKRCTAQIQEAGIKIGRVDQEKKAKPE